VYWEVRDEELWAACVGMGVDEWVMRARCAHPVQPSPAIMQAGVELGRRVRVRVRVRVRG